MATATRLAHTLKGTAGNIGAIGVQKAAAALELASTQEHEHLTKPLVVVMDELRPVLEGIAGIEETYYDVPVHYMEGEAEERTKELMQQLRSLVEDDDTDATEVIDELEAMTGDSVDRQMLKRLAGAVSEYDFDEALEILNEYESDG
jgi:HPt (histidine-containing phosphotransfer) domain-containing protein